MNSRIEHTDVGAYALGLLDDNDSTAFESHLAECSACRTELGELSGMASMLTGIGPVEEEPPAPPREAEVIDLLRRRKAADRRTRRGNLVIGIAAGVTLLAAGITVGTTIGASSSPAVVADGHAGHNSGPAEQFYAEGKPVTGVGVEGVSGGLVYESKGWGTHAALKLAGVKGPLECELIAVSKSGQRRVMTGWAVPPSGYGVPGQPAPLYMHGGSPLNPDQIDKFEVTTSTGKTLLTVDI